MSIWWIKICIQWMHQRWKSWIKYRCLCSNATKSNCVFFALGKLFIFKCCSGFGLTKCSVEWDAFYTERLDNKSLFYCNFLPVWGRLFAESHYSLLVHMLLLVTVLAIMTKAHAVYPIYFYIYRLKTYYIPCEMRFSPKLKTI